MWIFVLIQPFVPLFEGENSTFSSMKNCAIFIFTVCKCVHHATCLDENECSYVTCVCASLLAGKN